MKSTLTTVLITLLCAFTVPAQESDTLGMRLESRILIRYATAHIGNGEVIKNAYVEIQNGEISMVADANTTRIDESEYDQIIDAEGHHVYPGFIVMNSRLGLVEIDAVSATRDYNETGDFLPNISALPAFNSESKIISTVRTNGVLMAQIAPVGGVISGASAVVHFNGWNWQEAAIKEHEGIYLNWPERYKKTGWWAEPGAVKINKQYVEQTRAIESFFYEARAYQLLTDKTPKNLRLEAIGDVFNGRSRLYIQANWARDILDVVQFVREHKLSNVAIVGGAEAFLVATELKENNIAVVLNRIHSLPVHDGSPVDEPYALAGKLAAAGIRIAFSTSGGMEAMTSRNLPFQAGTAVHYGLDYESAIKALCLWPAQLAGIDNRYGSLEPGKSATLFISTGDALDISTNNLSHAFIEGRLINLENHQSELNKKFAKRIGVKP